MAGAVGDILQVNVRTILYSQHCYNILHYKVSSIGGSPPSDSQVVAGLGGALGTASGTLAATWLPCICPEATLYDITVQRLYPNRTIYQRWNWALPGSSSGVAIAPACTLVLTKRSDVPGRGRAGRVELAGCDQTQQEDGYWNFGGAIGTALAAFKNQLTASVTDTATSTVYVPVIFRRSMPASSAGLYLVDSQPEVRTERRRVVGRGI